MPRIKGIPRQFDPLDSGHKSAADPTQWRETDKTTIERTITTMFKCDPPRTSSHLQAKKSPGEVTHVNNFLESYTSEKGGNAVDPLRTPFTILIPSMSFPFPAKLPIPPLGLELTSVAASTPLTPTPPTDAQSSTGSSKEVGESGKADEKHPTKAGKPAKNKKPKKDGIAPTGTLKVKVEAAEEEELEEKEVVNLSDTGLNSPPLRPLLPNSRYYLPERVSNSAKRDRDKEIITCSVCEKTMRRGSLREHMDRHENSGKFECHLCGKTFSRASAREKHIRTHTGERPYICAVCPKSYRQKVHLNEHMRSHTGERPFVCRLCGFSLTSKSLLNRHLRTHGVSVSANDVPEMWLRTDAPTEQVLAAAAEVGRSLVEVEQMGAEGAAAAASEAAAAGQDQGQRSPSALRVTALNGTATVAALARRHLCNVCPAGFPTLQALRSHRLTTHGLMTPHICPTCEASFTSLKLMKVHCRKAHPQICPICDEKMPQRRRWILELHLRDKHPGVSADSLLGPSPMALGRAKRARRSAEDGDSKTAPPRPSKAPRHRAAKVPLPDTEGDKMEEEEEEGEGGVERKKEGMDDNDVACHPVDKASVRPKLEPPTDLLFSQGDDKICQAEGLAGPPTELPCSGGTNAPSPPVPYSETILPTGD